MAKRRFDWRLAIVLFVAILAFAATLLIVQRWQRTTALQQSVSGKTSDNR
ncbi:MAG: hypothetical protein ACM3VT_13400 [Solirubrobacterales bacterium]